MAHERIDVTGTVAIPRWQHMVIEVNVMSTSTAEGPLAAASRSITSVVSSTLSPLEQQHLPGPHAEFEDLLHPRVVGTCGPIGRLSRTDGGPASSRPFASRRSAERTRLTMVMLVGGKAP